jgi:hypothetical protein
MESARFRFGLFEFDTASRELRREGALVRLQSQPAQVLDCLIQQAGQVVSRRYRLIGNALILRGPREHGVKWRESLCGTPALALRSDGS